MDWMITLVPYLIVNVIPIFGEYIYMTNIDCDTEYDMDTYKTVTLEYKGSDVLYSSPCSVEFTKSSYDQAFCISAQQVHLDCETKLEYHEYFVKSYIDPEKRIFCTNTTVDEWCPDKYQSNIFIVIRKPSRASSDYVKVLVYLKNVPDDYSFSYSSSSFVWLALIVPVVFLIVLTPLVVWRIRARRMAAARRPQVMYQTTSAAVNVQTGHAGYQVPPQGYNQVPQSAPPFIQGDYHVHPMQSAYPVTNTQYSGQQGLNTQPYPSAPPPDSSAAPPPPYESIVGKST